MKILVVDDSRVMRMIVKRQLRQAGFGHATVVEAANGVEGLAAVAACAPDLVLSDWNMPEMSGHEFLRALRAAGNPIPFGFVTSEGTTEMRELARGAGAQFLVSKPFTDDDFSTALSGLAA